MFVHDGVDINHNHGESSSRSGVRRSLIRKGTVSVCVRILGCPGMLSMLLIDTEPTDPCEATLQPLLSSSEPILEHHKAQCSLVKPESTLSRVVVRSVKLYPGPSTAQPRPNVQGAASAASKDINAVAAGVPLHCHAGSRSQAPSYKEHTTSHPTLARRACNRTPRVALSRLQAYRLSESMVCGPESCSNNTVGYVAHAVNVTRLDSYEGQRIMGIEQLQR